MTRSLKDVIRTFVRDAPEAVPAPEPQPEAGPAPFVDGPAAAAMVDWLDAMTALADLLDEETAVVERGDAHGLDAFARRKLAVGERLEALMPASGSLGTAVAANADLRAMALRTVERLERSVRLNAAALAAMRDAVTAISRHLLRAAETAASDGLYARSGQALRPVELSASGVDAQL